MSIHLAARAWGHAQWRERFYPPDLPADWDLAYYANEFMAVGVPGALWLEASADRLQGWLADTGAGFRFFLLLEAAQLAGAAEPLAQAVETLGEQCAGLVVFEQQASRASIEVLNAVPFVELQRALVCRSVAEQALCELAARGGLSLNWQAVDGRPGHCAGELGVLCISEGGDPRRLRELAETARAWPCAQVLILFEGSPPDLEAMHALGVILELLGESG